MIKKLGILCCMALMATIGVFSLDNGKAHAMDTYSDIDYVTYYASTPSIPQALKNAGNNIDIPHGAFYQKGPIYFSGYNPDRMGFAIDGKANGANTQYTINDSRDRSTYKTYTNNTLGHPIVWADVKINPGTTVNHDVDVILYRQITDSHGTEVWKRTAYKQVYAEVYNASPVQQVRFDYDFNGNYLVADTYMMMFSDPDNTSYDEIGFYQDPYPFTSPSSEMYYAYNF